MSEIGEEELRRLVPDVRKQVTVQATPEHCFRVLTARPSDWWPPTHTLVTNRGGLGMEPRVGGRVYEWDRDGSEATWGIVLTWEPPYRMSFTWRVNSRWEEIPDDEKASVIEVTVTPVDAMATTVELAHVRLHRHAEHAVKIHAALDGPSPGETLSLYAKAI